MKETPGEEILREVNEEIARRRESRPRLSESSRKARRERNAARCRSRVLHRRRRRHGRPRGR